MISGSRGVELFASWPWGRETAVGGPDSVPEMIQKREKSPEAPLQPSRRPDSKRLAHQ
jgi:hypothetical protein